MISGTDHLETVLYETGNRVAKIALNRPKALNASNAQLRRELLAVLETAAADDDVRIVILTGMGRAFCSGADLEEIHNMPGEQIQAQINIEYKPILLAITQMPKLVISALNGAAVGVGATACFYLLCVFYYRSGPGWWYFLATCSGTWL